MTVVATEDNALARWRANEPAKRRKLAAFIAAFLLIMVTQVWALVAPSHTADNIARICGLVLLPLLALMMLTLVAHRPDGGENR